MPTAVVFNNTAYNIPNAGELNWSSLTNFLVDVANNAGVKNVFKQDIRIATSSPVAVSSTGDFTVLSNLAVAGPVAVNLPSGVLDQVFVIGDDKGDALTNNITITGNGGQLINGAANLVISKNKQAVWLQFDGTEWKVIASYIPPGTLVDADISATAAIARSKVANGTADHVVINNGTGGLSSEATLAKVRGGSGQDNSSLTFPASGTIATLADVAVAAQETTDAISTNVTVAAGITRNHHHFVLNVANTITVTGTLVSIGPSTANGDMTNNGTMHFVGDLINSGTLTNSGTLIIT